MAAVDSVWVYPALFGAGVCAGFVDSIAGGGGLLTLPVLLNLGLPPKEALATNKLQSIFGSASATWHYGREGLIDFRGARMAVAFTATGALAGTVQLLFTPSDLLRRLIPLLLIAVALYVLFKPRFGSRDTTASLRPEVFAVVFGLLLGFYDGFFGPGTGSFWTMAYALFLGFNLTRATAHTKFVNLVSNAASLLIFLFFSNIWFLAGITMGLGQVIGARLGSTVVIKRGIGIIRPMFIAVVLAITAKLIYENVMSEG